MPQTSLRASVQIAWRGQAESGWQSRGEHIYCHIYWLELIMGQVTIYLDAEAERKARAAAQSEGLSLSKWFARRLEEGARTEWPAAVRELAGAWPDLPSAEQIRRTEEKDVLRQGL